MKVENVDSYPVGTVIQFKSLASTTFDMVRLDKQTWQCWEKGQRDPEVGGAHWATGEFNRMLASGTWVVECVIHPNYNSQSAAMLVAGAIQADVKPGLVPTENSVKIEFTQKSTGDKYKLLKEPCEGRDWKCVHFEDPDTADGAGWATDEIREHIIEGTWRVDRVVAADTEPTSQPCTSLVELAKKYKLTINIYPDGLVWLSNGPVNVQIQPDESIEDAIANAEKTFATIKVS